MKRSVTNNIIVALDYDNAHAALTLADQLDPQHCRLKIGKELFVHCGPSIVKQLIERGFDIFLDLKFHDIPHTVVGACRAAAELGVWMLTVHASGGLAMLQAARAAVAPFEREPLIVAVTILTSLAQQDLTAIGISQPIAQQVLQLAQLARQAELAGVVCSAHEAKLLRDTYGEDFCLVTPGIRLVGDSNDDQHRIVTPEQALQAGADYLVIGRPITQVENPAAVLQRMYASM